MWEEEATHGAASDNSIPIQTGSTPADWQKERVKGPRVSIIPTASLLVLWVLLCAPHFLVRLGGQDAWGWWGEGEQISQPTLCFLLSPGRVASARDSGRVTWVQPLGFLHLTVPLRV